MPKLIYYVGLKGRSAGGETAFMSETGIRWFEGESHQVADAIASRMLAHPDVFTDKSPEERAKLEAEARARAAKEQAAARGGQAGGGSLEQLLAALPPGTTIKLANGAEITMPALSENTGGTSPAGSLEGAHASKVASRLSAAVGIPGDLDGEQAMKLKDPSFGDGDERVEETQVGDTNHAADGMSLAPGGTVAAASPVNANGAAANIAAPAPTTAPPAAARAIGKAAAGKRGKPARAKRS